MPEQNNWTKVLPTFWYQQMYKQEQATLAAKDWLRHLEAMEDLPASPREWRLLSIDASVALAERVNANGPLPPEDPCGL